MGEYLKRKVLQVSKFHPEIEIIKVNTDIDHMHIMLLVPPKISVSSVVRLIKTNTTKAMRDHFYVFRQGILGSRRYLVDRIFCVYSWNK